MTDDRATPNASAGHDPDARWLDALAGRAGADDGDANDEVAREASMMREALRRWPVAVDPVEEDDPTRIAQLLERARREGLLDGDVDEASRPVDRRRFHDRLRDAWRGWRSSRFGPVSSLAAVATLLIVVVVGRPGARPDDVANDATVRGTSDAVTLLTASDPEALRAEIDAALARQGVVATRYRRFGRVGLDADLPQQPSADLRAVLARYRIALPADGVLRLEIEPPQP